MKIHPVSNLFPMLDQEELRILSEDIRANGLLEPITIQGDTLLDGRNRLAACKLAKVEPRWQQYEGDPVAFIISTNLKRRHLTESQKAALAVELEEWFTVEAKERQKAGLMRGSEKPVVATWPEREHARARDQAAAVVGVGGRTVSRAKAVKHAAPELFAKVQSGELTATAALRKVRRDAVERKVSALPRGTYRVFYADPPWSYGDTRSGLATATGAVAHYPTMSLADICALPVRERAAADAVLFLWVPSPLLPDGLQVMSAWSFTYKASFVWDKIRHNLGHYNSVRHEFLLLGTRGSCLPDTNKLLDSVISVERTAVHSQKPEQFRQLIDTLYPKGPRLELFARTSTDHWHAWGNEIAR